MRFRNRSDAGRRLASRLQFLRSEDANVSHFHGALHANALLFGFDGGELRFVTQHIFGEPEFSSGRYAPGSPNSSKCKDKNLPCHLHLGHDCNSWA